MTATSIDNPVFSIITPTYKRAHKLVRNIKSVIGQSFESFEHIVIDDANDPETEKIIKGFNDKRIVLLKHDNHKGAAAAYNTGIQKSKGEFVSFLDDDDEYFPGYLETVFRFFNEDSDNTDFIWTGIEKVKAVKYGEPLTQGIIWNYPFPGIEDGLIAATSIGNGYGVCIRRECLEKVGLYDESLKVSSDTEYLFRLALHFNFTVISIILVRIHEHESSQLTDVQNDLERIDCYKQVLARNKVYLGKYPGLQAAHYNSLARIYYRVGDKNQGRKLLFSIIKEGPFALKIYADFLAYEISGKNFSATRFGNLFKRQFR